jgi:hypothetical protein
MIKGINSSSQYIVVTGGSSPSPNIHSHGLSAGSLRYNPGIQSIEIYDGMSWQQMYSSYAGVDLSNEAKDILAWASVKMRKEKELDALCEKYPGLAKARDNFEMFKTLVDAEESADHGQVAASP